MFCQFVLIFWTIDLLLIYNWPNLSLISLLHIFIVHFLTIFICNFIPKLIILNSIWNRHNRIFTIIFHWCLRQPVFLLHDIYILGRGTLLINLERTDFFIVDTQRIHGIVDFNIFGDKRRLLRVFFRIDRTRFPCIINFWGFKFISHFRQFTLLFYLTTCWLHTFNLSIFLHVFYVKFSIVTCISWKVFFNRSMTFWISLVIFIKVLELFMIYEGKFQSWS